MSRIVHGNSHKALKHFRKCPAALSVYWVYIARANIDNVAWPSIRGLAEDTGWSRTECHKARQWLVECSALKEDTYYTRPMWRHLSAQKLAQKRNFDRAKYYRPTGALEVGENPFTKFFDLLYAPEDIEADPHVDTDEGADVLQDGTSNACTTGLDIQQGGTELNISKDKLDSSKDQALQEKTLLATPAQPEQLCTLPASADKCGFPDGTVSFEAMLDHVGLTQADLDEIELDPIEDEPETKFGYTVGDTAWLVEDGDYHRTPTIHEVEIVRFTKHMVEIAYDDNGPQLKKRRPHTLSKTRPTLERKTTPLQDALADCVFGIPLDAPIGRRTMIDLNTYIGEIMAPYPTITAEHVRAAFAWKGEFKPSKFSMVVKMLGDYRDHLVSMRPANGATEPTVTFIYDPPCPVCNYGMVTDGEGKSVQCPQCAAVEEKEIA